MMNRSRDPFDELFDVFRDFDSLFRRTWGGLQGVTEDQSQKALPGAVAALGPQPRPGTWPEIRSRAFHPAVDCITRDGMIILRMELPGVSPGDVEVDVEGNRLTIRGEKHEHRESKEGGVFLKETAHGRFERSFTLPEGVKLDQVKARHDNGVLEVTLPAQAKPARKVTIEVSGEPGRKPVKAAS